MFTKEIKNKIEYVLSLNIHESIILNQIIKNGSTTTRDLLPFMNYPCGPIRDLQKVFGIPLEWVYEIKEKSIIGLDGIRRIKKIKYKRYKLAEFKGV